MEALACLKLSTVYSNFGHVDRAAEVAEVGVRMVPDDAAVTRLRLEGNLAITRTWLTDPEDVVAECERIAAEATRRGLDHFAAIGFHNAGEMQLRMGLIKPAIANLVRAAAFWAETPTNPFGHNEDLVMALLADGQFAAASSHAAEAIRRTAPWPRPKSYALYSLAAVLAADERYDEAISAMREATADASVLGARLMMMQARTVEYLFLASQSDQAVKTASKPLLDSHTVDPRYFGETAPAIAIALHVTGACIGRCQTVLESLDAIQGSSTRFWALVGRVKIGALALDHRERVGRRRAWLALREGWNGGYLRPFKGWVRRYATDAAFGLRTVGPELLASFVDWDPDGWRAAVLPLLATTRGAHRALLLAATTRNPNRATVNALRGSMARTSSSLDAG